MKIFSMNVLGRVLLGASVLFCVSCSESTNDSDSPFAGAVSEEQNSFGGFASSLSQIETSVLEEGSDMLNYGHLNFAMPADSFLLVFEYGDVVSIELEGYDTFVAPVVGNYDDVSSGEYLLRVAKGKKYLTFAINYGQVGVDLGDTRQLKIAKDSEGAAATPYIIDGGIELPIKVRIVMKEKGGYLENLKMREAQNQGTSIDNYPNLTVQEYANFRMVKTTGMGEGRFYRSSSPIDPSLGRSAYVDSLAREAHIAVFLNLTDTKAGAESYEGFADSYYASQNVLFLGLPAAFSSSAFKDGFVKGLRHMITMKGPYLVHCREGKDRAGYVSAVLEALMGASLDEIKEDYVKTYTNYYNVQDDKQVKLTEEQKEWFAKIIVQNLRLSYAAEGVEFDDFEKVDLQAATENYLEKLGLDATEIKTLESRLSD